jgi:hypothetical protein
MDYEYVEDVAEELNIDSDVLQEVIDQLNIKTLQLAVPPYGAELATAVDHRDAERLRSYIAAKTRLPDTSETLSCPCKRFTAV